MHDLGLAGAADQQPTSNSWSGLLYETKTRSLRPSPSGEKVRFATFTTTSGAFVSSVRTFGITTVRWGRSSRKR